MNLVPSLLLKFASYTKHAESVISLFLFLVSAPRAASPSGAVPSPASTAGPSMVSGLVGSSASTCRPSSRLGVVSAPGSAVIAVVLWHVRRSYDRAEVDEHRGRCAATRDVGELRLERFKVPYKESSVQKASYTAALSRQSRPRTQPIVDYGRLAPRVPFACLPTSRHTWCGSLMQLSEPFRMRCAAYISCI